MRPLLVVLGLAFVAVVLISNVDARIKCYAGENGNYQQGYCAPGQQCSQGSSGKFVKKGCSDSSACRGIIRCCNSDFCNGDDSGSKPDSGPSKTDNRPSRGAVTSTPPAPLLTAVIFGVIAAFGI